MLWFKSLIIFIEIFMHISVLASTAFLVLCGRNTIFFCHNSMYADSSLKDVMFEIFLYYPKYSYLYWSLTFWRIPCSPIWIYLIRCHASMDRFGNWSGNESCLIFTASRFGPFGRISNVIIGEIVNHTHELSYGFIICVVHFLSI